MVLDTPSASLIDGCGNVLGAAASATVELLVDSPGGVLGAAASVPELLVDSPGWVIGAAGKKFKKHAHHKRYKLGAGKK